MTIDDHVNIRAAFTAWAQMRNAADLIEGIDTGVEHIGIMNTIITGRRVTWRSASADRRARITAPSIEETLDAWTIDAPTLRRRSDHIDVCRQCSGGGQKRCALCNGIGNHRCEPCSGQGKMYGYAVDGSRRLLNCAQCRGRGAVDCAHCRNGIANCASCNGEGRVQRWLEIEQWQRQSIDIYPPASVQQLRWSAAPSEENFARDTVIMADVHRTQRITADDAPSVPPSWFDLLAPLLKQGERIAEQRVRIARYPTFTVHYRLGDEADRATFVGHRLTPPAASETPFTRRATRQRLLIFAILIAAIVFVLLIVGAVSSVSASPTHAPLRVSRNSTGTPARMRLATSRASQFVRRTQPCEEA